jgi:hypothetical protein
MDQVSKQAVDTRLERASELAAYLRDHPQECWKDAEELGQRFLLAPSLVSQIQVSSRSNADRPRTKLPDLRIREGGARIWSLIGSVGDRVMAKPALFLLMLAVISGGIAIPRQPKMLRVVSLTVWVAGEAWCLLVKPKFRNVLWGTMSLFLVLAAFGELTFYNRSLPRPFDTAGGHIFFSPY